MTRTAALTRRAPDVDIDPEQGLCMEVEAKYRVADRRVFADLLRMHTLDDLTLTPHRFPEHQRNTYFDTADGRLAAQRTSLRIREASARRVATLKRSRGGYGAVHIRDEWEAEVGGEAHPSAWPSGPAREQALALIGPEAIHELFSIHTRRHRVAIGCGPAAVAELCLDEGHIRAGGRVVGFRELEIELASDGSLAELERIGALFVRRYGLTPEPRGKRSRGIQLLQALTGWPRRPAVRAAPA